MEDTVLAKIKEEHLELFFLFRDIELSVNAKQRAEFFDKIKAEIIPHMKAEDETIYEKLRLEILDNKALELVIKSNHDHHDIREYLQRLNLMSIESEEWMRVFEEFKELTEQHCNAEELELFPEAKEDFSREELIEIGNEFEEARNQP